MANYSELKKAISDVIKANGAQQITGQVLQNTLLSIVSTIGVGSTFAGVATPQTAPGTPDQNLFYLASLTGTYSNFNNITIEDGESAILEWRGTWVKKNIGLATTKKLSEIGSFGCNLGVYVHKDNKVGEVLKLTTKSASNINSTNLLSISKKISPVTLTGLFSNGSAAPSYVVLDKDLKILSIVSGVSSATINDEDLADSAEYIVANSKSNSTVVKSNKGYLIDSGISVIIALEFLENKSNVSGLIKNVDTIGKEVAFIRDEVKISSVEYTRNKDLIASTPIEGKFLISRQIKTFGGKITKLHTDFNIESETDFLVCVAVQDQDGKFNITSKNNITISSKDTDLRSYDIEIPVGLSMVSIFIDSKKKPGIFKYMSKGSTEDGYESKAIYLTEEPNIGDKFSIYSSFKFICANYYFEIEATIPVSKKVLDNSDAIKTNTEEIENIRENIATVDNRFKDKHVVIFGDSITWYGGDDLTGDRGWTKYFKERFKFKSIKSYARSGATMTATKATVYDIEEITGNISPNNCLYNQVNRMINAISKKTQEIPDYIFVALGTNDLKRGYDSVNEEITVADELGKDYSTEVNINTCTTFIKAMRFFHDQIWNVTKDVQIIILTPLQRAGVLEDTYKTATQIKKIANFLAWPVIDLFSETCLSCVSENLGHAKNDREYDYTADGLHPTARGAKFNGYFIAQKAKNIMRI